MVLSRYLIVNADDFGLTPDVNRGIIKAHEQGIVTSTSLMVRQQAAEEAANYALNHPRLAVGLHLDLCEWAFTQGAWRPIYEVVPLDDSGAVAAEVSRQLDSFRHLTGRNPTHLDSHQHVHRTEPVRSIMLGVSRELGLVLRGEEPGIRYCGAFYGQSDKGYPYHEGISVEAIMQIFRELPEGVTEVACHPGEGSDINSIYREEREIECLTLCNPRVREALATENIDLCSFRDWKVITGRKA